MTSESQDGGGGTVSSLLRGLNGDTASDLAPANQPPVFVNSGKNESTY
jgi:hypothetical protein